MTLFQDNPDVAAAYDVWAERYDSDPNKTRERAGEALRAGSLNWAGRDVLEIGCGTGMNTLWLAGRAGTVLGLDISEGMLKRARERVKSPWARFIQADVRRPWPVADASADLVVAMLVLEHVEGLDSVFREARRALRPGGELFVCELHPMRQMMGRQARFIHPRTGKMEKVAAFLHDVSEYLNLAGRAGFSLVDLGEWRDPGASRFDPPRVLSARFRVDQGRFTRSRKDAKGKREPH